MGDINALVEDFVIKLKRRQIEGSLVTAHKTAEVLRQVIAAERKPSPTQASQVIELVKGVGRKLIAANPVELAIGNIVRRVLHIIREEEAASTSDLSTESTSHGRGPSGTTPPTAGPALSLTASALAAANRTALRAPALRNLLESVPGTAERARGGGDKDEVSSQVSATESKKAERPTQWKLKHNVIEGVNELIQEIDNFYSLVGDQALEHIHQNEVILTLGGSKTVSTFFGEARKKRSFQVVVAEGAPRYVGHSFARELAAMGISTTVITDSAVFAMMARVNMVIVGAHAVMANGGVIASVGMHMVALAARRHAVPFVVLAGIFKLSPVFPHSLETMLNDLKSPAEVLDLGELSDCINGHPNSRIHIPNPSYDYIPPELVSLHITDGGGHNPSYVYRLISEYYSPEDYTL